MNQTAVVNIKVDSEVKKKAQEVAKELGFSLSAVLTAYMKQLIRRRGLDFTIEDEPSDYFVKSMKESEKNVKEGWVSPKFDNSEDAMAWLNNPKRKYVNQLRK